MADDIDTWTIWLPFDDGEVAISVDLSGWNSAWRRVEESLAKLGPNPNASPPPAAP